MVVGYIIYHLSDWLIISASSQLVTVYDILSVMIPNYFLSNYRLIIIVNVVCRSLWKDSTSKIAN